MNADEFQDAAICRLRREYRQTGSLSDYRVREIARLIKLGPRQIRRRVADPAAGHRRRKAWVPDEQALELLTTEGNVFLYAAEELAERPAMPSSRTIRRALSAATNAGETAMLVEGERGMRARRVHVKVCHDAFGEWQLDSHQVRVWVKHPVTGERVRAWLTDIIDCHTKVIVGYHLSPDRPHQGSVLHALRDALLTYGQPLVIQYDNGGENTGQIVGDGLVLLDIVARLIDRYSPHQDGVVEAFHHFITLRFSRRHPNYSRGPKRLDGFAYEHDGPAVEWELFVEEFAAFIAWYHDSWKPRPLKGRTPSQMLAAAEPLPPVPEAELRWMLSGREAAKVGSYGIRRRGRDYLADELIPLGGERVEIAFWPHCTEQIEVYYDNKLLCTAIDQDCLSERELSRFTRTRKAHEARLRSSMHAKLDHDAERAHKRTAEHAERQQQRPRPRRRLRASERLDRERNLAALEERAKKEAIGDLDRPLDDDDRRELI